MALSSIFDLEVDEVSYGLEGLKILIFGGNTIGKTPQSMRFPKPLLLMGESGGSALKGHKKAINKKKDFLEVVTELTSDKTIEKAKEKFSTIILDCVEDIIEVFEVALSKEYGVRDVGEIQQLAKGNPNGYSVFRREFKQQVNLLTSCGYTVIFISHEETIEVENEDGTTKTFIQPKGSKSDKSSARFIRDLCDFRFYIKGNGVDPITKETIPSTAWCVETDKFYAGSRFKIQSFVNPFTAEGVIKAIEKAQKRSAEEEGSGLKAFSRDTSDYTKEDYFELIKPYVSTLYKLYPDMVTEIIESQLGNGVKVSQAKDTQLVELETIYGRLVDFACDRGIGIIED